MIVDPKIILTIQMLEEYFKYFTIEKEAKVRYLGINSLNLNYGTRFKNLFTNIKERRSFHEYQNKIMFTNIDNIIKKEIESSIKEKCPLLVFSTYKSFSKLQDNY